MCSVLGVVLFVAITYLDASSYQPDIRQADEETPVTTTPK